MQTFMPYEDFNKIAKCLDDKRLYKQVRVTSGIALNTGGQLKIIIRKP